MYAWARKRKRSEADRIEVDAELAKDKHLVDTIREIFGMAPLYAPDPLLSKTDEERFGARIYREVRAPNGRHYDVGA